MSRPQWEWGGLRPHHHQGPRTHAPISPTTKDRVRWVQCKESYARMKRVKIYISPQSLHKESESRGLYVQYLVSESGVEIIVYYYIPMRQTARIPILLSRPCFIADPFRDTFLFSSLAAGDDNAQWLAARFGQLCAISGSYHQSKPHVSALLSVSLLYNYPTQDTRAIIYQKPTLSCKVTRWA